MVYRYKTAQHHACITVVSNTVKKILLSSSTCKNQANYSQKLTVINYILFAAPVKKYFV